MNLSDIIFMLRRGWLITVVLVGLGAHFGHKHAVEQHQTYSSTAQAYVVVNNSGTSGGDAYNAGQAALGKMASYTVLAKSIPVTQAVIDAQQLAMSTSELVGRLTVEFAPGSLVITITGWGNDETEALNITAETMRQLAKEVEFLETPAPGVPAWTRLIPIVYGTPPQLSEAPVKKFTAMGAAAGLVLGVLIAFLLVRLDPRVRTKEGLAAVFGADLLSADDPRAIRGRILDAEGGGAVVAVSGVQVDSWPTTRRVGEAIAATGASVLVVDAQPKLAGATAEHGLADRDGFAELLRPEVGQLSGPLGPVPPAQAGSVTVLPSGVGRADLPDLLASSRAAAVVAHLAADYDHVLIDGIRPTTDTSVGQATQLLVVKSGKASPARYRSEAGVDGPSAKPRIVAVVQRLTLTRWLFGLARRVLGR